MEHKPTPCYLTCMVALENPAGQVLILNRIKSWPGYTFPGGHLEASESILACARREVLEETGLTADNLQLISMIHWEHRQTGDRYLVFCLKGQAQGKPKASEEGNLLWLYPEDIKESDCSQGFYEQIPLFLGQAFTEAYGRYGDGQDSQLIWDRGDKS